MDVVIFNGSPRRNGNTVGLTSLIKEEFISKNVTVKEIFLYPLDIRGCSNCGNCQTSGDGRCVMDDDMIPLYSEFIDANLVIIASPIYMWNLTACTKTFIERLHALCKASDYSFNAMRGKRIALAVTMGDDEFVAASAVNAMMFFCEYFRCVYSGTIAVPFADEEQISGPACMKKVRDFVQRLSV